MDIVSSKFNTCSMYGFIPWFSSATCALVPSQSMSEDHAANTSKMGYCFPHKMAVQFSISLLRAGLWVIWTESEVRSQASKMQWVTPGKFLVCFLDAFWYISPSSFADGPMSQTSLHAGVTALAADLDKKVVRKGGKLGSKEIAFLCISPVPTGTAEKASSGRLGFWIIPSGLGNLAQLLLGVFQLVKAVPEAEADLSVVGRWLQLSLELLLL